MTSEVKSLWNASISLEVSLLQTAAGMLIITSPSFLIILPSLWKTRWPGNPLACCRKQNGVCSVSFCTRLSSVSVFSVCTHACCQSNSWVEAFLFFPMTLIQVLISALQHPLGLDAPLSHLVQIGGFHWRPSGHKLASEPRGHGCSLCSSVKWPSHVVWLPRLIWTILHLSKLHQIGLFWSRLHGARWLCGSVACPCEVNERGAAAGRKRRALNQNRKTAQIFMENTFLHAADFHVSLSVLNFSSLLPSFKISHIRFHRSVMK